MATDQPTALPGHRLEKDPLGYRNVPDDAYYGVQVARAIENFTISGMRPHVALVRAVVQVKKAAARANLATGRLPRQIGEAIVEAADEILAVTGGVNPGDVSPEVEEDEPGRPTDPLGRAFAAAVEIGRAHV